MLKSFARSRGTLLSASNFLVDSTLLSDILLLGYGLIMTHKPNFPENYPTTEDIRYVWRQVIKEARRRHHASFTPEQISHIADQARICRALMDEQGPMSLQIAKDLNAQ